jgi:alkylation response protein AidB-like acyl-CoA dehydrogenase
VDELDSDLIDGTEEQRTRYLPGLTDGTLIGANGASEPDAGSDVFSMRSRAVRDGDGYVLTGTKIFVTNATVADLFVVYATIDPKLGATGSPRSSSSAIRPGSQ